MSGVICDLTVLQRLMHDARRYRVFLPNPMNVLSWLNTSIAVKQMFSKAMHVKSKG